MTHGVFLTDVASVTNCILENNKIRNMDTAEVSTPTDKGHKFFMTDASGHVGINRPIPNSGAFLEVGGDIAAGYSDTGKIALHNAAGTEIAFLQIDSTVLKIDANSDIIFKPNNTDVGRFLTAGQLDLVNELHMSNNKAIKWRNNADNDNLFCMELDSSDILTIAGDSGVLGVRMPNLKSGTDQAAAGASENELYVDTNDDNTIKLGASI